MKISKHFLILSALLFAASCVNGEKSTPSRQIANNGDLLEVKTPQSLTSQIKDYEGFRLSFNKDNGTPNWVSWELLARESDGAESRSGQKFWQDDEIVGCRSTDNYRNSGYDRGHMCPAADQKWSPKAMADCFSMANIAPQAGELNRGAWQTLEKKERLWAQRDGRLIIVCGPVYDTTDTHTIDGRIRVPSAFFKVFLAPDVDNPRAIGFIYPNMTAPGNYRNYAMSVDQVEQITGLDFFPQLDDQLENAIESTFDFKVWDAR